MLYSDTLLSPKSREGDSILPIHYFTFPLIAAVFSLIYESDCGSGLPVPPILHALHLVAQTTRPNRVPKFLTLPARNALLLAVQKYGHFLEPMSLDLNC